MKRIHVYFDPSDAPYTRLDTAIEVMLAGLLSFCPLAFGAVHAWSEQIFFIVPALMLLCLLVKLILRRDARTEIKRLRVKRRGRAGDGNLREPEACCHRHGFGW